jgi:hypothetical protein
MFLKIASGISMIMINWNRQNDFSEISVHSDRGECVYFEYPCKAEVELNWGIGLWGKVRIWNEPQVDGIQI